jgi:hypothetical protein
VGKLIFFLFIFCFFVGAQSQSFTVLERSFFGEKRADSAIAVAAHWTKLYGSTVAVVLSPLTNPDPNEIERAISGHIAYSGAGDIKSVILHSMTHAVKPKNPTILKKSFLLGQDTVIGFHGLNLLIKTRFGEKTYFTKIEEGVAERAAIFAGLGYSSYSLNYVNLATLTKNHFTKGHQPEPVEFVKKNDVYAFVAEFLGKKKEDVKSSDVVTVASVYQQIWDMASLIPERQIYK